MGDDHQRGRRADQVPASQATASTSRWLVGSSSTIRSCVAEQQRGQRAAAALATGEAEDRPVERDPGEQHLDDLAGASRRRPLVVVAAAQHGLAHGVGVDELVALVEVADRARPRFIETRPESGSSRPVITSSRVVLPSPLRPTMPIRSPSPMPRETSVEQRADAVGLGDAFEVDQVGHQWCSTEVGAGDGTVGDECTTSRHRTSSRRPAQRTGARRLVGGLAQEHAGRAGAGDAGRAARRRLSPRSIRRAEVGSQVDGGRLQVVVQGARPAAAASPLASAASSSAASAGVGRRVGERAGRSGGRPRGSTARRRPGTTTHHQVPRVGHRLDELAAAGAEGGAAEQRERDVAAQLGGEREQVLVGWCRGPRAGRGRPGPRRRRPSRRPARRRPGSPCGSRRLGARGGPWWAASRRRGADDDVVVVRAGRRRRRRSRRTSTLERPALRRPRAVTSSYRPTAW